MLRALIVASVAAVAGHQLYKRGLLPRLGTEIKRRTESLRRHAEDKIEEKRASHEAAGGPGGGPIRPISVHNHQPTTAA